MKFLKLLALGMVSALTACQVQMRPVPEVTARPIGMIALTVDGHSGFVTIPTAQTKAWVWFAPTLLSNGLPGETQDWLFSRLQDNGIAVAGMDVGESYGSPDGTKIFDDFYNLLVSQYELSSKPCLFPQSRGGLMLYDWAEQNPQFVSCIGGIYPVVNLETWPPADSDRFIAAAAAFELPVLTFAADLAALSPVNHLASLAADRVPILHLHGDADFTVPLATNSLLLADDYAALGGQAEVIVIPGKGHEEVPEFFQSQDLLDFFVHHLEHSAIAIPLDDNHIGSGSVGDVELKR